MNNSKDKLISIGERIKYVRKELDISQIELAEKADISVPYLSKIEAGKSDFGVSVLIRLSEALQVSTDKLLRPDIPETTIIVSDELSNLLIDCTPTEKSSIVETAKNMKKAFYEAKKEKI